MKLIDQLLKQFSRLRFLMDIQGAGDACTYSDNSGTSILGQVNDKPLDDLSEKDLQDAFSIVYDAINSTVGGIVITDNDGKITYVNSSFLKMFDFDLANEVIGRNAADLFSTDEVRKFSDVKEIIDMSKGETEEFSVIKNNDEQFTVEVRSSNVTNNKNQVVGRMASFVDITGRKQIEVDRERLIKKLQIALDKINTLKGFIPICSSCKKIRDDSGYWHQVEEYIRDHSEADFTHGICPDCVELLYPEMDLKKYAKNSEENMSKKVEIPLNKSGIQEVKLNNNHV